MAAAMVALMRQEMVGAIATHSDPVWREKADFLIHAPLSGSALAGRSEQLWVRRVADNEFEVCCIPFFTYGVSLGDRIRTERAEDGSYVLHKVVERSGRSVYRLWFGEAEPEARNEVVAFLQQEGLLGEWSSANLLAVDVAKDATRADGVRAFLEGLQKSRSVLLESGE